MSQARSTAVEMKTTAYARLLAVVPRSTKVTGIFLDLGERSGSAMRSANRLTASKARRVVSWRMVVRSYELAAAMGRSSKPTTWTSAGTRRENSCLAVSSRPKAVTSVEQNTPSGRSAGGKDAVRAAVNALVAPV